MKRSASIIEHGSIRCIEDYPNNDKVSSPGCIYLNRNAFDNFRHYIEENSDGEDETERSFSIHLKRGKYEIKVKNYVGVVETRDGTSIEILPKIHEPHKEGTELIKATRATFLRMLKCLRNSPFINISNAHLKSCKFPILEVFITTYLEQLEKLVKEGIKRQYVPVEENQSFLKGKLLFSDQIRQNLVHPERFYVSYDRFDANIPQNRLVKSTLIKLAKSSRNIRNQNLIRKHVFMFDEVPESKNPRQDLIKAFASQSRLFLAYEQLLLWAKVFLLNESFTNFKGQHLNKAILFPMEQIFEDYVSHHVKKHYRDWDVSTQDNKHHLVREHAGKRKFKLRPDIVMRKDERVIVIDCKWKLLNEREPSKNYNISQGDMYQLYAYGKKYTNCEQLFLLYPLNRNFTKPLEWFNYEKSLKLHVLPVDLRRIRPVSNSLKALDRG